MANKLSLLLGLFFLLQFVVFCGDIIGYQLALSKAYVAITYANDYISEKGAVTSEIQDYMAGAIGSSIECEDGTCQVSSDGAGLDYSVSVPYTPLLGVIAESVGPIVLRQRVYIHPKEAS